MHRPGRASNVVLAAGAMIRKLRNKNCAWQRTWDHTERTIEPRAMSDDNDMPIGLEDLVRLIFCPMRRPWCRPTLQHSSDADDTMELFSISSTTCLGTASSGSCCSSRTPSKTVHLAMEIDGSRRPGRRPQASGALARDELAN
jgi:hypothetical protein